MLGFQPKESTRARVEKRGAVLGSGLPKRYTLSGHHESYLEPEVTNSVTGITQNGPAMAAEHILRLPRNDTVGFVLVNVTSNGPLPLDLQLLATEGESPYIATSKSYAYLTSSRSTLITDDSSKVKQKRISKLRDHRNKLSDAEWETTLLSALTQRRAPKSGAEHLEKLEVIAALAGGSLTITLRQNISGITQKLSDIILKQDDEQGVELISWADTAVQRSDSLESEVMDLTAKYDDQTKTMEKLNKQLEDLIVAKKEHEDALLEKFRELLNTKKLKIRDQQRLLAGAKVDPKQAANLTKARASEKGHRPTASRAGKRKANGSAQAEESSEEDGFDRKPPTRGKEESDGTERADTPEASDQDAKEDESDDDLDSAPRDPALPDRSKGGDDAAGKAQEEMQLDTPPPTRELPFGKADVGSGRGHGSMLNQEAGNEDEETDDDEL